MNEYQQMACPDCKGKGGESGTFGPIGRGYFMECSTCHGDGLKRVVDQTPKPFRQPDTWT